MTEPTRREGSISEMTRRIAALSPEKRALLEARLGNRQSSGPAVSGGPAMGVISFTQERIHKLVQSDPESRFFVTVARFSLQPPVGVDALRSALAVLAQHHEALRNELMQDGNRPVLIVRDASSGDILMYSESTAEQLVSACVDDVRALKQPLIRVVVAPSPQGGLDAYWVAHALICDGPSLRVLHRDLLAVLDQQQKGAAPSLPPVQRRPSEHAHDQRRRMSGPRADWMAKRWRPLESAPSCLALHTDHLRGLKRLPDARCLRWPMSVERLSRADVAATAFGVSAEALWATIAAVALGRFARQDQVVIGVLGPSRTRLECPDFVGVSAGAVPVGLDLSDGTTFRAVLDHAEAELRAASVADIPHEALIEALRLPRSYHYHPLFQVALAVLPEPDATANGLDMSGPASFGGSSIPFDVAIVVAANGSEPGLQLWYDAHLFEASSMRPLAQALETLLDAALDRPEGRIADLPLIDPALSASTTDKLSSPPAFASTIHGLFERRTLLDPQRVALEGEATFTYAELDKRATALGRALRARGIQPGDVVGVCMKRSADLVISFLAILKIGAIYLPLDPLYPAERLAFMIRDSRAKLVLQYDEALDDESAGCAVVDVADLTAQLQANEEAEEAIEVDSSAPAYLMYTSGSTGQPKGVLVQHRGVCHVADAQVEHFDLSPDDRILQFASPSFDASIFELVMAARCGGTLYLASSDSLMPGAPLVQLLKTRRISVLTIPPSALGALAPIELPDLRIIVCAGETCPAELVARWARGRRFFNAYGPTEASIWATVMECHSAERAPPIGRPLSYVRTRVVDDNLRPVPAGVPGELLLGGPGVALGYLNLPELTQQRFLEPNGFEGRWYRTGDLVRCDSSGVFWHLGRIDRQVKVRGFRIEPGEIEASLLEVPGIRSAAVEVEDSNLVAYYTADSEQEPRALQRVLGQRLPPYMVPTTFVPLPVMPVTANGKLDREALRRQPRRRAGRLQSPRTPTEFALAEIWKSVLRLEQIGVNDNFFDLGGHSLLATSVISRASVALGKELSLREFFRAPTIAQLAYAFDNAGSSQPEDAA